MSIKVVCGCGFATLLPSDWQGKRVRCKCGRTFVVGVSGAIVEPPAQALGGDAAVPLAPPDMPSAVPEPAAPRHGISISPPEEVASAAAAPAHVAEALHRERQATRRRRRSVVACTALITALALASALGYVLRLHDWSLAALLQSGPGVADAAGATSRGGESMPAAGRDEPAAKSAARLDGTAARPVESTATRLANLMPLVSEDGLLLTGLFGDADQRLQLTDAQREAIQPLVTQLQASEQPLRAKSVPMDQWYADTRRLGDQLLAVLTDDQRQQLQILLEQGPVVRVQLVEYAARILPELAVPQVPWSLPTDGRPFRDLAATPLARVIGHVCGRSAVPTGVFVTRRDAAASDARPGALVWDMAAVEPLGRLEMDPVSAASPWVLSHGGTHVALTRVGGGTAGVVEVWETASGRRIGSRELPGAAEDAATVRACLDHAVVATTRRGFWVWKFPTDELLAFDFPEALPDIAPGLVVSPQGKYLTVAHRYIVGDAPDIRCFLEVCVYSVDSGELLGNQLLHREYRSSTVSAMVLSDDGRELALVWDFDGPEAARKLVHMHASSGKIIRIVDGLQPPRPADAAPRPLSDRALICLPENSGWVVDLRQVVDAETGAVLALDELAAAEASSAAASSETWVEVIPTSDGRLRVVTARPEDAAQDAWTLETRWINLPKLGPFR